MTFSSNALVEIIDRGALLSPIFFYLVFRLRGYKNERLNDISRTLPSFLLDPVRRQIQSRGVKVFVNSQSGRFSSFPNARTEWRPFLTRIVLSDTLEVSMITNYLLAHELGHVVSADTFKRPILMSVFLSLGVPTIIFFDPPDKGHLVNYLGVFLVSLLAVLLISLAICHLMWKQEEYRADRHAIKLLGIEYVLDAFALWKAVIQGTTSAGNSDERQLVIQQINAREEAINKFIASNH